MLALNGMKIPGYFHGESVLGLAGGQESGLQREHLFLFQNQPPAFFKGVVWKNYKYFESQDGTRRELYDLEADPGEKVNLADEQAGIAEELKGALDRYREIVAKEGGGAKDAEGLLTPVVAPHAGEGRSSPDEDETLRRLRGLGYVK